MRTLALVLAMLAASGCVSTTLESPDGLKVSRVAFWSDFTIEARRKADGSLEVVETQEGNAQEMAGAILDALRSAAGR